MCFLFLNKGNLNNCLVGVSETTHTRHHAEHVVVGGIDTDLGGLGTRDGRVRQHQLKGGVINAREIARAGRLVLFRAEGEGVKIDTGVGVASVVLVRLDQVKVGAFTLREAVLTVKLQLGSDNGILTPAVHVEGRFSEDEGSGIRHTRCKSRGKVVISDITNTTVPLTSTISNINGTGVSEETRTINKPRVNHTLLTAEGHDGVREGINTISVVEGLSTERLEEGSSAGKRAAVVNVLVRLNNKD